MNAYGSASENPYEVLSSKSSKILSIEEIDKVIIDNINKATEEDSDIWTRPDYNKREYIHSFFQYPARMIPAVQRKLIEIITTAKPDIQTMIDPFMGSATTLVTCMESGLKCYGQDINPLAVLIGKARTGPYFTTALKAKWNELELRIDADESDAIDVSFKGINKWFKEHIQIQLSKIVRGIRQESSLFARRFFWVVLAETIRVSSNDRTSTYKLHIRKQEDIDKRNFSAIKVFALHMDKSIDDFESHATLLAEKNKVCKRAYISDIDIRLWDSKQSIFSPTGKEFYDLLVTSPPYGDNKTTVTYGQNSYLPLQWIDLSDIDSQATSELLKSTSEIDTRSLGGVFKKDFDTGLNKLFEYSPTFKKTYEKIEAESSKSVKKVATFFIDLNQTLDNVFRVMKPNSYQIWTVGNRNVAKIEVPNDEIIIELIESKGGKLLTQVKREIINKRMGKKNRDTALMNTEDILIFRKVGE
ncbi:site-specific DNA-methyltransferase [Ilyomonas limi]|uniref:site-specific DNA-methyltransferase (cytosine-N(4)-specific) n=1 Tax=Ilyomonas limi TaxID=2575867 RepID=A0A4U3LCK4_9BACT|nr:DNA methyltransferase [Ilyomonas limi]TKK71617.1 site-specific DNA-methyltransferase [Ilyomonas limi]